MEYKKDITSYFKKLKETIDKISIDDLDKLINILVNAKEEGKIIFIMGNGGSSATASHYVCDFNKGVSLGQEKKFKFICLNDNIPSLMAYANDFSFEDIFICSGLLAGSDKPVIQMCSLSLAPGYHALQPHNCTVHPAPEISICIVDMTELCPCILISG